MTLVEKEFTERVKFYEEVWWPARTVVENAIDKRFETWKGGRIISFDKTFFV